MIWTAGRRALVAVLSRTKAAYVAATCRRSVSSVSEWASGRKRPNRAARAALEERYRIRADSWDRP